MDLEILILAFFLLLPIIFFFNRYKYHKNKKSAETTIQHHSPPGERLEDKGLDRTFKKFRHTIVGIGFTQSSKDACAFATRIFLVHEDDNPKDKNAIAVYSEKGKRIGYIPRGEKEFLQVFHSHNDNFVEIVHRYYNEEHTPVKYCEMDIEVTFCEDHEYLKKVMSERDSSYSLYQEELNLRKEFKNKELSDEYKLEKIIEINDKILEYNTRAEKVSWVRIPIRETIIIMNRMKLTNQVEVINKYRDHSEFSSTQEDYIANYLKRQNNHG